MKYAERFDEILISCPYIKRWIEKNGYKSEKIRFTELLKFREETEVFNRHHVPEAVARYAGYEDDFEDVVQEVYAEIVDYGEDDEGFLVTYRLKKF
ncbi:hypothetical protein [Geoglobus sp.]